MSGVLKVALDRKAYVFVPSLAEASKACRDYITARDLGGSEWSGGKVRDESGAVVAIISYNGRVWTPEKNWRERREISLAPSGSI